VIEATSQAREARIGAFRSRVEYAPHTVMTHRLRKWRYIPADPFADEPEVLRRLGISPATCRRVDAFWEVAGDAVYLRVQPACDDPYREAGLYARWAGLEGPILLLLGLPDREPVSRVLFEAVMSAFADCGLLDDCDWQDGLSSEFLRVAGQGVG